MAGKAFKFTQRSVEDVKCPPDKREVFAFDSVTRGFGLCLSKTGTKTFVAQYRASGAPTRVRLGTFGVLTVEEGRKRALEYLGAAAAGRDVKAERKGAAVVAKQAAEDAAFTFGVMVQKWGDALKGERRPSYLTEAVRCCTRNLDGLKDRPASSIASKDFVRRLDTLKTEKGITTANRTKAYASAAYGWAVSKQLVDTNPLKGIKRPGREKPRERVLAVAELGAIWRGTARLSPLTGGYIRTLMLTMQRREEVASMQWAELAEDCASWTLPGDRAKNGRATIVHLSEPVRDIIRAMPHIEGSPFVFAGRKPNEPIRGFNSAKVQLDRAVEGAGDTLLAWSFHDFRRSGVTELAGRGFAPHVCDRILNHITGSIQGVAAVYQRHEFLKERKAALDAWAALVTGAAEGKPAGDNVVQLHGEAA